MNYNEETEEFVNQVINDILNIPNLQEDTNPLLTKEIKARFQNAKERLNEILASFNALPGVTANLYEFDSDPNGLLEINIPATSFFLRNKEEFEENGKKDEIVCFIVGFNNVRSIYTDLGEINKPKIPSDIFLQWQEEFFCKPDEFWSYEDLKKTMTVSEFYVAVQKLIASYLEVLEN